VQPGYMLYDRVLRPAEVGVTEALNNESNQNPEAWGGGIRDCEFSFYRSNLW